VSFQAEATWWIDMAGTTAQPHHQHFLLVDPVQDDIVIPGLIELHQHFVVNLF